MSINDLTSHKLVSRAQTIDINRKLFEKHRISGTRETSGSKNYPGNLLPGYPSGTRVPAAALTPCKHFPNGTDFESVQFPCVALFTGGLHRWTFPPITIEYSCTGAVNR